MYSHHSLYVIKSWSLCALVLKHPRYHPCYSTATMIRIMSSTGKTEVPTEKFLLEVRKRPCLWDPADNNFRNENVKKIAFCLIANKLVPGLPEKKKNEIGTCLSKKWKGIREHYVKVMRDTSQLDRYNNNRYIKLLGFLDPTLKLALPETARMGRAMSPTSSSTGSVISKKTVSPSNHVNPTSQSVSSIPGNLGEVPGYKPLIGIGASNRTNPPHQSAVTSRDISSNFEVPGSEPRRGVHVTSHVNPPHQSSVIRRASTTLVRDPGYETINGVITTNRANPPKQSPIASIDPLSRNEHPGSESRKGAASKRKQSTVMIDGVEFEQVMLSNGEYIVKLKDEELESCSPSKKVAKGKKETAVLPGQRLPTDSKTTRMPTTASTMSDSELKISRTSTVISSNTARSIDEKISPDSTAENGTLKWAKSVQHELDKDGSSTTDSKNGSLRPSKPRVHLPNQPPSFLDRWNEALRRLSLPKASLDVQENHKAGRHPNVNELGASNDSRSSNGSSILTPAVVATNENTDVLKVGSSTPEAPDPSPKTPIKKVRTNRNTPLLMRVSSDSDSEGRLKPSHQPKRLKTNRNTVLTNISSSDDGLALPPPGLPKTPGKILKTNRNFRVITDCSNDSDDREIPTVIPSTNPVMIDEPQTTSEPSTPIEISDEDEDSLKNGEIPDSPEEDPDQVFLMSLLPEMKAMSESRNFEFRMEIMQALLRPKDSEVF